MEGKRGGGEEGRREDGKRGGKRGGEGMGGGEGRKNNKIGNTEAGEWAMAKTLITDLSCQRRCVQL